MDFWKASKICEYVFLFLCYMTLFTNFIFHFYFHIAFLIHIICIFLSHRIATYSHHAYCRQFQSFQSRRDCHIGAYFITLGLPYCRQLQSRLDCCIATNFNYTGIAIIITPGLPYCHPFHYARIAVLPPISSRLDCRIAILLPPISIMPDCQIAVLPPTSITLELPLSSRQDCCIATHFITPELPYCH